ncbi:MAG: PIG-L family deacetylase [Granulosicoccus sp.]|nr:PIG-L family deacetylase [Granulosicoccus sp.]
MPLTDPQIITAQAAIPRVVVLWRALQSLRTVCSFMNTGAHPDDETSSLLAALRLRDGLSISYACANRGEGGQNDIGTEASQDLGVIRTAEMERAASILDMSLYWLSQSPEDSIYDFGFSKSGTETLANWNHDRALSRLVSIVRQAKPDIMCPTFLDIPGQHGHHRAMTQLAEESFDAAADPNFKTAGLKPWQVTKLYLPAWSGAGDAYDDDLPPPPATLTVDISGVESATGWSWLEIGQQSRVFHRTQGMGRWTALKEDHQWPLHLLRYRGDFIDDGVGAGLSANLAELGFAYGAGDWALNLQDAQADCLAAIEAWPVSEQIEKHAVLALVKVRQAMTDCPADAVSQVIHRLKRKELQLSVIIKHARGVRIRAVLDSEFLRSGSSAEVTVETSSNDAAVELITPGNWKKNEAGFSVPEDAQTHAYPEVFDPLQPALPALSVTLESAGVRSTTLQAFELPPVVLPVRSSTVHPEALLVNCRAIPDSLAITLQNTHPADAEATFVVPEGWTVRHQQAEIELIPPADLAPGLYNLPLTLEGETAQSVRTHTYPHIHPRARSFPAACQVRVIDSIMPEVRLGYLGGGNDRVDFWLRAMGFTVTNIDDEQLTPELLSNFDTLVVGIFALRTRPAIRQRINAIHEWVHSGGNLLTLYHRPWDNWDAEIIPPRPLAIGKPSLRWRVTDETATVTHLLPDHVLLNYPNRITGQDWDGWHKERGLYFAMSWDDAYEAPLSMQDPGESAHLGALLSARVGLGRHTHTSLILHHQMEKLVPGAFNLMANLVAPCRTVS